MADKNKNSSKNTNNGNNKNKADGAKNESKDRIDSLLDAGSISSGKMD